jgi:hypothetical protein
VKSGFINNRSAPEEILPGSFEVFEQGLKIVSFAFDGDVDVRHYG